MSILSFACARNAHRHASRFALAAVLIGVTSSAGISQADELRWKPGAAEQSRPVRIEQASDAEPKTNAASVASSKAQQAAFVQPIEDTPTRRSRTLRARRPSSSGTRGRESSAATKSSLPNPVGYPKNEPRRESKVSEASVGFAAAVQTAIAKRPAKVASKVDQTSYLCGEPGCGCALGFGCGEGPGCGIPEPTCGCVGPTCGCPPPVVVEAPCAGPVCGEPVCGDCVCGDVGCAGGCGAAVPPSLGGCAERGAIPLYIYLPPIKEIVLYAGVQGFKAPIDYRPNARDGGNFGFHEGVNIGGRMSWLPWDDLGFQIGYTGTQNQLSGDVVSGSDSHSQQFFTTGLFHREFCGWQWGVVYDLLQDERQGALNFSQVRGLFSYTNPTGSEVGFEFAAGTSQSSVSDGMVTAVLEAADQYKFFWRHHGPTGGEFRAYLGGSGDSHVIIGGDLAAPLNHRWSIETGFTYFIPTDEGNGSAGANMARAPNATEEAWQVGVNLVWHYGARAKQWYRSPWRPMFQVANNGSLVVDDVD